MGKNSFILGIICCAFSLQGNRLITNIVVEGQRITFKVHETLKKRYLHDHLFVEYDNSISIDKIPPSLLTIPLVLHMFPVIWASGDTYYIDELDYDLYYSLRKLKKLYKQWYPKTQWKGRLIPKKVIATPAVMSKINEKLQTAVLFDGGLDAWVTSLRLRNKRQLLIAVADVGDESEHSQSKPKRALTSFAQKSSADWCDVSLVSTNGSIFLNTEVLNTLSPEISSWYEATLGSIGKLGASIPLLYTKGYPTLHIASCYKGGVPHKCIDYANYAGLNCISENEHSFLEKLSFLIQESESNKDIQKCFIAECNRQGNIACGTCGSCLAIYLGLYALDKNPQDYGYNISSSHLKERAQEFFSGPFLFDREAENFRQIQKIIMQKISQGNNVVKDLGWIREVSIELSPYASASYAPVPVTINTISPVTKNQTDREKNFESSSSKLFSLIKGFLTYCFG